MTSFVALPVNLSSFAPLTVSNRSKHCLDVLHIFVSLRYSRRAGLPAVARFPLAYPPLFSQKNGGKRNPPRRHRSIFNRICSLFETLLLLIRSVY